MAQLDQFSVKLFDHLLEQQSQINNIIIVSHDNSDIDAVASVIGMQYLITRYLDYPLQKVLSYIPEMNRSASHVFETLKFAAKIETKFRISDQKWQDSVLIVLDSSNMDRISGLSPPFDAIQSMIMIDHHEERSNDFPSKNTPINEKLKEKMILSCVISKASSTSELIAEIWKHWDSKEQTSGASIDDYPVKEEVVSQLLLDGIMADSARLKYSSNKILSQISWLVEFGADIAKIDFSPMERLARQERIARIKGASRIKNVHQIGKWIVLFTEVNAYESSVCRSLLSLGGDIVFCMSSKKKKSFRLIGKTSEEFQSENQFNLGKFMESLGENFEGSGGGHTGAGGFNGRNFPKNIEKKVLLKLRKSIEIKE